LYWVGLGWVSQLMGWVGSGHAKWTHGQLFLCPSCAAKLTSGFDFRRVTSYWCSIATVALKCTVFSLGHIPELGWVGYIYGLRRVGCGRKKIRMFVRWVDLDCTSRTDRRTDGRTVRSTVSCPPPREGVTMICPAAGAACVSHVVQPRCVPPR